MAQEVRLMGATYSDVPSVLLPDSNNTLHAFTDTSDANAVAGDIASGKTAYVNGVKVTGTGSGGSVDIEALNVSVNGTYTAPSGKAYSPVTVNVSGGPAADQSKPVKFIDYDGTLLYSYTVAEMNALTQMPANPSHTGLTAQGWNYTLAQAKTQATAMGSAVIGQMYTTSDGKTRVYITIDPSSPSSRLTFNLYLYQTASVSIDWGDGTSSSTESGSGYKTVSHTYLSAGDYVIALEAGSSSGTYYFTGTSSGTVKAFYGNRANDSNNVENRGRVRKIELGDKVTSIGTYAFYYCYSLDSISIPNTVTSIGTYAFSYCHCLRAVVIPNRFSGTTLNNRIFASCHGIKAISIPPNIATLNTYLFQNCYSLIWLSIPSIVTSISTYVFASDHSLVPLALPSGIGVINSNTYENCHSFSSITIPSGVSSIYASAFNNCFGLYEVHLKRESPPSLDATAFGGIPSQCVFYVPVSENHTVLNAYKTATGWTDFATRIQEEPS